jgi:hypothetical protein
MNSRFAAWLALGVMALSDASLMAQFRGSRRADQQAAKYGWLFNLEEGKSQARKNGHPLMVVLRCVP